MRWMALIASGVMLTGLVACGDDSGGIGTGIAPRIQVTDGATPLTNGGIVAVKADLASQVYVGNLGTGPLELRSIELTTQPEGAFTIESSPMPSNGAPVVIAPHDFEHRISVIYDATAVTAGQRATGAVTLRTNRTVEGYDTFTFNLAPEAAAPRLLPQPRVVDFESVDEGASATRSVALLNTGAAELVITRFHLAGHTGFSADIDDDTWYVNAETAGPGVVLEEPIVIAPGHATHIDVAYAATGPEPAEGQLVLVSNDPSAPNGTTIRLFANVEGPCIQVNPSVVDFGGKLVGQSSTINMEIISCGDRSLRVEGVSMVDDAGGSFSLNTAALGLLPLDLQPNASIYVPVQYLPAGVSTIIDGQPQRDVGTIRIRSDAYLSELDVEVTGFGTDGSCPTPQITVAQGQEVIPQTNLQLSAESSTSSGAAITGWEWSVIQPTGSNSSFVPSPFVERPTFEANIIGEYIFRLKVVDAHGMESCDRASYTVFVTSDEAIHVELTWDTPGDPNPHNTGMIGGRSAGSDMDLHLLHPNALSDPLGALLYPGGWFHDRWDCYWANPRPQWGTSANQNPSLDRDDTDGWGPENMHLSVPQNNTTYKVGVHYWDDWEYGPSYSTVRIYIYGQLRMQWGGVFMINHDMWECCNIAWNNGNAQVTRIEGAGGSAVILPNFFPMFF